MLTDKAKRDFEKWYLKMLREKPDIQDRFYDEHLLSFFWNSDDVMRNGYIVAWFDSVKYIITVRRSSFSLKFNDWYFIIENERGCHLNNFLENRIKNDNRDETLINAISKANEIYNKKN